MSKPKALMLIGSPRGERSNSYTIGKFLAGKLEGQGFATEEAFVIKSMNTASGIEDLLALTDEADIIIFATPLYIDSLPSYTIKAMEQIHAHRIDKPAKKNQLLVAIVNSGFPEPSHNNIALNIIRNFAQESGLRWGGGVRIGMGEAIGGKPISEKGMTRKLAKGLSSGAISLSKGQPMSQQDEELASQPFLPPILAKLMMISFINRSWNQLAKRNNANRKMRDRPYEMPS
jgi:multimeric flavodoxin WrbA